MKNLIFTTVHGSHLYGLAHENSDRDYYEVYEGKNPSLRQRTNGSTDVVRGTIDAFLTRAVSGSHQSVEALFSPYKAYTSPEMLYKWDPLFEGLRITGHEVFEKYERTIRKFCYGDFKRRRHAVRLSYNLTDLRNFGRFNPTLTEAQVEESTRLALELTGDELRRLLNV